MEFNVDKCRCPHLGYNNPKQTYIMGGKELRDVENEKDLGITINRTLNSSEHVTNIVQKANQIVGSIRRRIEDKSKTNIINL